MSLKSRFGFFLEEAPSLRFVLSQSYTDVCPLLKPNADVKCQNDISHRQTKGNLLLEKTLIANLLLVSRQVNSASCVISNSDWHFIVMVDENCQQLDNKITPGWHFVGVNIPL